MKSILKRLTEQLEKKGMPVGEAVAVATKKLQAAGDIKKGSTKETPKGKTRTAMGAAGRAKDRASKKSGTPVSGYKYSTKTNRATKK
jgi:hypothetical protein